MLTRYRVQLYGDRTRESVRLELKVKDASIKLSTVASTPTTVSARAMLTALIDGERDLRRTNDQAVRSIKGQRPLTAVSIPRRNVKQYLHKSVKHLLVQDNTSSGTCSVG
jgi:hypothetical protein